MTTTENLDNAADSGLLQPRLVRLRQKAITILELARPVSSTEDPAMKTLLELVNDIIAATEPNETSPSAGATEKDHE